MKGSGVFYRWYNIILQTLQTLYGFVGKRLCSIINEHVENQMTSHGYKSLHNSGLYTRRFGLKIASHVQNLNIEVTQWTALQTVTLFKWTLFFCSGSGIVKTSSSRNVKSKVRQYLTAPYSMTSETNWSFQFY